MRFTRAAGNRGTIDSVITLVTTSKVTIRGIGCRLPVPHSDGIKKCFKLDKRSKELQNMVIAWAQPCAWGGVHSARAPGTIGINSP